MTVDWKDNSRDLRALQTLPGSTHHKSTYNKGATDAKRRNKTGFMRKVRVEGEHWVWLGPKNVFGEPVHVAGDGHVKHAYVIAVYLFKREMIGGGYVRRCDVEDCVSPEHWTSKNNRSSRAKRSKGEEHGV